MKLSRRSAMTSCSAAILVGMAPRAAWGRTEADVVIIGAGLAGLYAATLLEASGMKTIVIEGEDRVGGRLHTLDDLPGRPEAGGIQVGTGYHRLRSIAAKLGVGLDEGPGGGAGAVESRNALFKIGGQTVTETQWPTSSANHLSEREKKFLPLALDFLYATKLPKLSAPEAWMTAEPAQDISYAQALIQAGASNEALRLIEANLNGNRLTEMSQLSVMRSLAFYRSGPGPTATIRGGSQRLPEAMAAGLMKSPRLKHFVTAIREDKTGVSITTNLGILHARHVICTIPFAALRHIHLEAAIASPVATMIASLPYTRASFAYLSATDAFWNTDGFAETLWTDDPLLGRIFVLGDSPPMLKLWTTGAGADLLDRMKPHQAATEIVARIESTRPAAKGKLRVERLFSWQKSPFARGIYHHIGTGQATTLAIAAQTIGTRIHFAGEHLAQASTGMEGALESGERVARNIIAL